MNGLRERSQIAIDKITTVPLSKIGSIIGRADDALMVTVTRSLALYLELRKLGSETQVAGELPPADHPAPHAAPCSTSTIAGRVAPSAAAAIMSPIPAGALTIRSRSMRWRRRRGGWRASRLPGTRRDR